MVMREDIVIYQCNKAIAGKCERELIGVMAGDQFTVTDDYYRLLELTGERRRQLVIIGMIRGVPDDTTSFCRDLKRTNPEGIIVFYSVFAPLPSAEFHRQVKKDRGPASDLMPLIREFLAGKP